MRSIYYSYIDLRDISKIEDQATETVLGILKHSDPDVIGFIANSTPIGTVRLTAVVIDPLGMPLSGAPLPQEVTLTKVPLFDLEPIGRLMCLGVGRSAHNQLRPRCISGNNSHMSVSRDHGVVYIKHRQLMYRDLGTFRKGSTNGTSINGINPFFNETIRWQPGDYLGIGSSITKTFGIPDMVGSVFRLRFISEMESQTLKPMNLI